MPRTRPGEYLVAARKGRLANLGEAANAVLFPGTAWVKVPGVQLDSSFEMTQETRDGIPLRFKGQAVYRVVRPERAAALFDFSTDDGLATVDSLVKQCCLAELRDLVSRMTMGECIEQRKTTLTGAVRGALERLVGLPEEGWGIAVEVVQVAQVYIVDAELRSRLDAETRGQIQARSERAALLAEEEVKLARIVSARKVQEEAIETERREAVIEEERLHRATELEKRKALESLEAERTAREVESQKLALKKAADLETLEAEAPVRKRRHELRLEELAAALEEAELERKKAEADVEREFLPRRASHELRLQMLPVEQRPQLAEAASKVLAGARLSVYGEDSRLVGALEPLLETLGGYLRGGASRGGEG